MAQEVRTRGAIVNFVDITIPSGGTESNRITVPGRIVSLYIPAAALGTVYTFRSGTDPVNTFVDVQDETGTVMTVSAATATEQFVTLEPTKTVGIKHVQIVSDQAQTSDVTFKLGVAELS